jgi:hypothetical protein
VGRSPTGSDRAAPNLTTVGTNRLESFSDGVIAVAITLLVLGLHVPSPGAKPHHSLIYALANNWPAYAAYITSFVTIGIIWINHHVMINRLTEVDRPILILNLLLLMTIGALPFATDLMATYLHQRAVGVGPARGQEREQLQPVAALVEVEVGDEHGGLDRAGPAPGSGRRDRR